MEPLSLSYICVCYRIPLSRDSHQMASRPCNRFQAIPRLSAVAGSKVICVTEKALPPGVDGGDGVLRMTSAIEGYNLVRDVIDIVHLQLRIDRER